MSQFQRFEDIQAWQLARELTSKVYAACRVGEFHKDRGLVNQITRACVSILSNIAEGFERNNNKEFVQFLYYAKGSAGEVRAQLYVALDQNYLVDEQFRALYDLCQEISRMIRGLVHYLEKSEITGIRHRR